jgi:hypothetical protein
VRPPISIAAPVLAALGLLAGCGSGAAGGDAGPLDAAPDAAPCETPPGATSGKLVRLVYLVPADREVDPVRVANLEHALTDVRLWLRARMPRGTSFLAHRPLVEVIKTEHNEAYYRDNPGGNPEDDTYWFWDNATGDAAVAVGAGGDDPDNIWLVYIDADRACGQVDAGWIKGLALAGVYDVKGLSGEEHTTVCGESRELEPRCRFVGGMANLLAGALAVPQPAGCVDDDPETECQDDWLTWLGYRSYPDAVLGPEEIEALDASPFMRAVGLPDCQLACSQPAAPPPS